MMNRLVEWLWNLNPKNRAWLESIMRPSEELARIDAEIDALLAKRPALAELHRQMTIEIANIYNLDPKDLESRNG